MRRLSTSLDLFKASWSVLAKDKELAAIPVVSFVCGATVVAVLGGAAYLTLDTAPGSTAAGSEEFSATPLTWVVGAVGYLVVTFVVTFFSAALVAGALERFRGGDPSLGSSLGAAASRLGPIAAWSLLTGTVGLILQSLQDRAGPLGAFVIRLIGMAWQIVTWLAVPVIVDRGVGPVEALKESASMFKRTWGENLIAQAGFGILGFLIVLPGLVIGMALMVALPILGIAVAVLWIALSSIVLSTLNGIYRAALYLYAQGQPAPGFPSTLLATAFTQRTGKFG